MKKAIFERSYSTGRFGNYKNFHRGIFLENITNQRLTPIRVLKDSEIKNENILLAFFEVKECADNCRFYKNTSSSIWNELEASCRAFDDNISVTKIKNLFKKILKIYENTNQAKTINYQILKEILGE